MSSAIPPPPDGFRVATSTREVLEAFNSHSRHHRSSDRGAILRLYVNREWVPGQVDAGTRPRRPITRNVPVAWGDPPFGEVRRLPFERIAIPNDTEER